MASFGAWCDTLLACQPFRFHRSRHHESKMLKLSVVGAEENRVNPDHLTTASSSAFQSISPCAPIYLILSRYETLANTIDDETGRTDASCPSQMDELLSQHACNSHSMVAAVILQVRSAWHCGMDNLSYASPSALHPRVHGPVHVSSLIGPIGFSVLCLPTFLHQHPRPDQRLASGPLSYAKEKLHRELSIWVRISSQSGVQEADIYISTAKVRTARQRWDRARRRDSVFDGIAFLDRSKVSTTHARNALPTSSLTDVFAALPVRRSIRLLLFETQPREVGTMVEDTRCSQDRKNIEGSP
ncbi:hypothetical protein AC579_6993 [Pseudocercospora musae]|uniref:Uncharacterized protein n=1 Tax=Pseudocercospora musae TaxID=113226 RepID=A0A139I919_9PEZI|nr:hypothetical protein AC579_6993 [Pseudocercospora musae]